MRIKVKLFGALRSYLPPNSGFNHCELDVSAQATLDQVVQLLPIPSHKPFLAVLNKEKIEASDYASTDLHDNDEVVLLPPIKGG